MSAMKNMVGEKHGRLTAIKYAGSNCKWIPKNMQARNTRHTPLYEYKGELLTRPEIAKKLGVSYVSLYNRMRHKGMSLQEAICNLA
jgi:hypothetical protein